MLWYHTAASMTNQAWSKEFRLLLRSKVKDWRWRVVDERKCSFVLPVTVWSVNSSYVVLPILEEEGEAGGGGRRSSRVRSGFSSRLISPANRGPPVRPLPQNKLPPPRAHFRSLIITLFTRLSNTIFNASVVDKDDLTSFWRTGLIFFLFLFILLKL